MVAHTARIFRVNISGKLEKTWVEKFEKGCFCWAPSWGVKVQIYDRQKQSNIY